jgi:acyl-CoA synthetase (AMP-forming)/AMP-acid ligase II
VPSDEVGASDRVLPISTAALLDWPARTFPGRVAIVCGERRITFADFDDRINRLANALLDLGLDDNARVAVLIENSPEAVEVRFAIMKAGLCMVPLNTRQTVREQTEVVRHSGSACLIASAMWSDRGVELRKACPCIGHFISDGDAPAGVRRYGELLATSSARSPEVTVSVHALERIAYTSGTTGSPKGVMRSFLNFIARLRNDFLNEDHVIDEHDVFLNVAPLTHAARNHVHKYYVKGGTNIVLDKFDAEEVLTTIERERATGVMLVPTMLERLLRYERLGAFDTRTLRLISVGTAPIPPDVLGEALDRFGPIVRQTYGLTEASQPILVLPPSALRTDDRDLRERRLASSGRPALGVEVRIVDGAGVEVGPGVVGEIVIRGDVVTPGYWHDPAATAEVLRDGWLRTGDLASRDDDGYVYVTDRAKDMIITGGFNVYSREVERALEAHPAVREAAVVGVPDREWGEAVVAFVVLHAGATVERAELIGHCQERIAGYKKPRALHMVTELPRNVQGKVRKPDLREEAIRLGGMR